MNNKVKATAAATVLLLGSAFAAGTNDSNTAQSNNAAAQATPTMSAPEQATPNQAGKGERARKGHGPRHMAPHAERPALTQEQQAEMQQRRQEQMQARLAELMKAGASNAQATNWLNEAQALMNGNENEQRAAHGLMRATEALLDIEPPRGPRGPNNQQPTSDTTNEPRSQ